MSKLTVNEIQSKNSNDTPLVVKSDINLDSGKNYKINGSTVLSSTQVHGKSLPSGNLIGHNDEQTLYSKTLAGFTLSGDVSVNAAVDIDLSLSESALSFDSINKSGILEIETTFGSEKVKMSGDLEISGDLTVSGTTTIVNSTTVTVNDKILELGKIASPSDATADGGGLTLKGTTDKTLSWINAKNAWTSSEHFDLANGKSYFINGNVALSATQVLGKTLPTGDVTGTSDSQTLTNKTISGTNNTITNIGNNSLTNSSLTLNGNSVSLGGSLTATQLVGKNLPTGDIIGSNDLQTLSSKTLSGFKLSGDITVNAAVDIDLVDNNSSALSFDTTGKAGILEIDTTNGAEKVKMSGDLEIIGNLIINGTTTTLSSTTITVTDKNIELGKIASPTNTTADGGGLTLKGATDKTFNWVNSTSAWTSSEHIDLASEKSYRINGTVVLSTTQVLGKTLPTGDIIGTSDSQTLSSKTLQGFVLSGDISINTAIDIDMPINSSAISFDSTNKSGILEIDTTNGAEKVKMSGDLEISGDLTVGSHFLRKGVSNTQTSGTINLSTSKNLIYFCNYVSGSGATVTSGSINFTNGVAGEIIYLRVKSDGIYTFGANMKFPSDIAPKPSASGKVDIYSFMCLSSTEYLGTFAFNYT